MSARFKPATEFALRIRLSLPAEQRLARQAAARGVSLSDYLSEVVERAVEGGSSFAEVCEPFASAVTDSDLTDAQFECLVEQLREEVWRERTTQ